MSVYYMSNISIISIISVIRVIRGLSEGYQRGYQRVIRVIRFTFICCSFAVSFSFISFNSFSRVASTIVYIDISHIAEG